MKVNGSPIASPRPKPSKKLKRFAVFELIGTREAESEEAVRECLPKGRVFKLIEVTK